MKESHLLQSPLLSGAGFVHAFFTRQGGVSSGAHGSLNLSHAVGDAAEAVAENRRRAARRLGVEVDRLLVPRQVHGRGVVVAGSGDDADAVAAREGDAVVSDAAGLACAVRTADCVPILIGDRETRRVAAVHAGWRGVVGRIVEATLGVMLARGCRPEHLIAAIGPHISADAFEVGEDVGRQLAEASDARGSVIASGEGKSHADLEAILRAQLAALGVRPSNIDSIGGCTVGEPERYFSYRRDGSQSGRQLSAIVSELVLTGAGAPRAGVSR